MSIAILRRVITLFALIALTSLPVHAQSADSPPAPVDGLPASGAAAGAQAQVNTPGTGSAGSTGGAVVVSLDVGLLQSFINALLSIGRAGDGGEAALPAESSTSAQPASPPASGETSTAETSDLAGQSPTGDAAGSPVDTSDPGDQPFTRGAGSQWRQFEKPLPGYPNLSLMGGIPGRGGLLRTSPGLDKAMSALQAGNRGQAIAALRETVGQMMACKRTGAAYMEGGQCQSTRYALKMAEEEGEGPGICNSGLKDAICSASRQMSPIVLDMNGNGIADVTTPQVHGCLAPFVNQGSVHFDVSGRGQGTRTEWLKPGQDGLLSMDSNGNGVVDSALELFGDADGFADGYAKLSLLDKNGDGWLTGSELAHLSVWIDDGDGVCQPKEMNPVAERDITAIHVTHSGYASDFVRSGRTCRTWDWFPRAE